MNLDQYREMKAQENASKEEQPSVQTNENTVVDTEQIQETSAQTNPAPTQADGEVTSQEEPITSKADTIEIDGKEIPVEELKNGYLRQSDYTRKTQELARTKKELEKAEKVYEAMNSKDEETAREISEKLGIAYVSPKETEVLDLQTKYEELVLERDIEKLQAKYGEFDVKEVLQTAYDKRLSNLEDAYHLTTKTKEADKPKTDPLDIEAIKEQIRQELTQELQSKVDTSSLISTTTGGKQVTDDTPQLSPAEMKVARAMRISPAEYALYKNKK